MSICCWLVGWLLGHNFLQKKRQEHLLISKHLHKLYQRYKYMSKTLAHWNIKDSKKKLGLSNEHASTTINFSTFSYPPYPCANLNVKIYPKPALRREATIYLNILKLIETAVQLRGTISLFTLSCNNILSSEAAKIENASKRRLIFQRFLNHPLPAGFVAWQSRIIRDDLVVSKEGWRKETGKMSVVKMLLHPKTLDYST